jgi:hypothetical protein
MDKLSLVVINSFVGYHLNNILKSKRKFLFHKTLIVTKDMTAELSLDLSDPFSI